MYSTLDQYFRRVTDLCNYLPLGKSRKEYFHEMPKKCIAVLTRGYTNLNLYDNLIKRNQHIETQLMDKTIDILIFHEGNISEEQQEFISKQTPLLQIIFTNVKGEHAFRGEKEQVAIDPSTNPKNEFGIGYRHMCSFWFMDVAPFVKNYDQMLRIDEDCYITSSVDDIFSNLHDYTLVSGKVATDAEFVTKGMNEFTLAFMNQDFKQHVSKSPGGPYTNLMALSLGAIREHVQFQKYVKAVDDSNYIYERRWGDLPLWGEAIHYLLGEETMLIDKSIRYFHESHASQVN